MEQKLIDRLEVSEIQELNESIKQKQAMERLKEWVRKEHSNISFLPFIISQ
jgi:hypothetical protein